MESMNLRYYKQDGDNVIGQEFSNSDMKGYFPKKMINLMISAGMSKGI